VDISHAAPWGTESDANNLATSFPHGRAHRNKQGHTKGVELLLDEHKKILIHFFMKGGDMKGEKKSAALMLAHLISIALMLPTLARATCPRVFAPKLKITTTPRIGRFMRSLWPSGSLKNTDFGWVEI
jgi:hypothetical protein